jgi:competence protein ComGC
VTGAWDGLRGRRGETMIGLLAVIVIIAILAVVFLRPGGKGQEKKSMPAQVQQKASGVECQSNLNQVRQMIQMYQTDNEQNPPSLQALSGLPAGFTQCPVGGEPYWYDPQSGRVTCRHPGHERF